MSERAGHDSLHLRRRPELADGTLVLAFTGWMDGGDASTGTVQRLVDLVEAEPVAEIDPEPFYIYNFPGSMEIAALFRPHIEIEDGLVKSFAPPSSTFYVAERANLALFIGREPNLHWRAFGECVFEFARRSGVSRLLFVGSFGGAIPHTREPRLYVTCSEPDMLAEMERYGVKRTGYEGPGSFTSYLLAEAPAASLRMASLVAEIPGYLQGTNPSSILAITRRLGTILGLSLDLDALRTAATKWELEVSKAVEEDDDLARTVRQMEEAYDDQLLAQEEGPG
ncbi:MAG TPA: PAC2 family protein [Planctomycetaceae bacterium]|nr:PAC2 family protein [Planctomycetaceae bacterium]